MILKTSNLAYVFGFDGVLTGQDRSQNFFNSLRLSFQKLHFNPETLDIRWCILTERPQIDSLLIPFICNHHNLNPNQIIYGPNVFKRLKTIQDIVTYKEIILRKILDHKIQLDDFSANITKVFYIDNNIEITTAINRNRKDYQYLAINLSDLLNKDYHQVLI